MRLVDDRRFCRAIVFHQRFRDMMARRRFKKMNRNGARMAGTSDVSSIVAEPDGLAVAGDWIAELSLSR
jgi:hypothetical protein